MSKCTKTRSNLQTSFVRCMKKHNKWQLFWSPSSNFIWITCFLNGKKRRGKKSVTAKVCQLLHFVFVCDFVCVENDFSVFMEQPWSSTEFFRMIHFKMKRVFNCYFPSVEHGLSVSPCVVWSPVFACPRTSVFTRVDLSRKNSTEYMTWIWAFWLVD